MFESGNLASRARPQHVMAMGREDSAAPMTLNEKVIAHAPDMVFQALAKA